MAEKEYREFTIHGREYWLSKDQIETELGCPSEDVEKIWNSGKIRKKKAKTSKSEKSSTAELAKKGIEEDVLAVMQKLASNGVVEVGSRVISDKLGLEQDKGRQRVRVLMKKLETAGKIVIQKKSVKGKRETYVYKLAK